MDLSTSGIDGGISHSGTSKESSTGTSAGTSCSNGVVTASAVREVTVLRITSAREETSSASASGRRRIVCRITVRPGGSGIGGGDSLATRGEDGTVAGYGSIIYGGDGFNWTGGSEERHYD
jgi:hypothetical protein